MRDFVIYMNVVAIILLVKFSFIHTKEIKELKQQLDNIEVNKIEELIAGGLND